jgi:hypothetical protein
MYLDLGKYTLRTVHHVDLDSSLGRAALLDLARLLEAHIHVGIFMNMSTCTTKDS